jgi:hypothetical protein
MHLTIDLEEHFIQMPPVTWRSGDCDANRSHKFGQTSNTNAE